MITDPRHLHHTTLGLGYDGFRAICSCGWRSIVTPSRQSAANAREDHRRGAQLRSVP
jgi:hypothetical protein